MNFVDRTLIALADPASRGGAFDSISLQQLVSTAYDTSGASLEGPFQAVFDEFRMGFAVPPLATAEGNWAPTGGAAKVEAQFRLSGIGAGPLFRVDAFWRGSVVARAVPPTGRITEVDVTWPSAATIDAEIIADLGTLPSDAALLEQERRNRLLTRIRASLDQPSAFDDERLDQWLQRRGVTSVDSLLANGSAATQGGAVQVTYSPPVVATPTPMSLPIVAGLMIRDQVFPLAQLLMESKWVRNQLEPLGLELPREAPLKRRRPLLVIWVIPETVFDDPDWPGGVGGMTAEQLRAARRTAAGEWLAREGIGLATIPPAP